MRTVNPIILPLLIACFFSERATAQAYDCSAQNEVPAAECEALITFYDSTGGDQWSNKENWLQGSIGSWRGVEVTDGHVTVLQAQANNLAGSLPEALTDLTELERLFINGGVLPGPFPEFIFRMTSLRELGLRGLGITGEIPAGIGDLTNLELLSLDLNELEGPLPETMANLVSLRYFSAFQNRLSGPVPVVLADLSSLEELTLMGNQFDGEIPERYGDLTNLQYLTLRWNPITGPIPETFGQLTELLFLDVRITDLAGPLPISLTNLQHMEELYYSETQLCNPTDDSFTAWLQGIATVEGSGLTCMATAAEDAEAIPDVAYISDVYPNPFSASLHIRYSLTTPGPVTVQLFDVLGREIVASASPGQSPGTHSESFQTDGLPPGTYVARLTTGDRVDTRLVNLVR